MCRNVLFQEWYAGSEPIFQEITKGTLPVQKGGVVRVRSAPGLGITVDFETYKRKFPYQA